MEREKYSREKELCVLNPIGKGRSLPLDGLTGDRYDMLPSEGRHLMDLLVDIKGLAAKFRGCSGQDRAIAVRLLNRNPEHLRHSLC